VIFAYELSRMFRRLTLLPLFYRVRDSAPDGSSPRDCALLLAMEDNLKIFYPAHFSQRNFLIRSRWEYDASVENLSTGVYDLCLRTNRNSCERQPEDVIE